MEYLSDVAIALSPNAYNNASLVVKEAFTQVFGEIHFQSERKIMFYKTCVKWYDDDENIIIIKEFLDSLNEIEFGFLEKKGIMI